MKSGNCPKCENADIAIFKPAKINTRPMGNVLMNHMPVGGWKSAKIQHYVCKNCGFIEQYIIDEDIKKI